MRVLKAGPGLDPEDLLSRHLGPGFSVDPFDPSLPLAEQVGDAVVLIVRDVPVPATVIDRAPQLKLIQRLGEHLVGVDIAHARARGIHVARVPPDVSGASRMVAEHAMFLLLALAKRFKASQRSLEARILGWPSGDGLAGRTLGLVGVGRSGGELARLAAGFGMTVLGVKRTPDPGLQRALGLAFLGGMEDIDEMLGRCDAVSIHLPLVPETRGLFGTAAFAALQPGAWLVNVARAEIVERAALEAALDAGTLAGAGLDVFWGEPADPQDPLLRRDDVVATPHLAGFTRETQDRLAAAAASNIRRVAAGEAPLHPVLASEVG